MTAIDAIVGLKNLNITETGDINTKRRQNITSMATTLAEVSASIKLIGYLGALLDEKLFIKAVAEGPKNVEFTKLISFLTNEIRGLRSLDEHVNPITSPEDSSTFIMEISSFLNELGCPYLWLTKGHVSERLSSVPDKLLLIEYLSTETMMARMHRERNPEKKIELKLHESQQAADLRKMLQALGLSKPPPNITMKSLMDKVIPTIKANAEKGGQELLGHPILNATLTPKKWEMLENIQQQLHNDFHMRRQMLLKRLDCTIQSFQWSNKTKGKEDLIDRVYTNQRKMLKAEPEVDISDLLAARSDLAIIEKTSNASVRKNTKSAINSVIIGQVPDRGGRTSEQAPPPPEMPSWQQRSAGPPSSGSGFRGGRGGSSNYSRGGGNQSNFGSNNPYSQSGQGVNNYGRDTSFNKSDQNYSSGLFSSKGGFDSAGNYGQNDNYSRGGGNQSSYGNNSYSQGGQNRNNNRRTENYSQESSRNNQYDNRRGSSDNYSQGGYSGSGRTFSSSRDYNSKDSEYSSSTSGGYSQGGRSAYDSAGSYAQDSKRPRTLDQYQPNKTSYADQYVHESNHNQQYQARGDNRGGRSNYHRGSASGGRGNHR